MGGGRRGGLKAYSVMQSAFGARPTIPQGMTANTALRVRSLVSAVHPAVKADLIARATAFREVRGFEAPYWTLVQLAREAVAEQRSSLAPALVTP
jgi:hypothetical protein